ncbi:hypothetical protein [Streptomyces sp. NBC_01353]|uniref:hypothetical protein n=1 Tax=Streptomyces sp. NBC_01353 TaxID=2903835 RepID=UPI002E319AF7|nr:hypothetical protein [Streptomyces sp. NBC_01353]
MRTDTVADALARIERAFKQPGRYLKASPVCRPGLEVEDARDDLEEAMHHLPHGARDDLGRLIARFDDEFERRTLPNPWQANDRTGGGWWWSRIREH